jgi:hypothetical protein
MSIFKRCISIFVVLAFVMTTMPMVSHGSSAHDIKAPSEKTYNNLKKSHPDCHGHVDKKASADKDETNTQDKGHNKKSCCDKVCKRVGGTCHSSIKVYGSHDISFVHPLTGKSFFAGEQIIVVSNLHSRIKRPPKA